MPYSYSGYIMKLSGECGKGPPVHRVTFCVLFKTKGNQSCESNNCLLILLSSSKELSHFKLVNVHVIKAQHNYK